MEYTFMMRLITTMLVAHCTFSLPAYGQNNDDCTSPELVVGTALHAFDTAGATTSGFTPCGAQINNDRFYEWISPWSGITWLRFSGMDANRRMKVMLGSGCPTTCVGNSDGAALFYLGNLAQGDRVLMQVGSDDMSFGAGTFQFSEIHPNNTCFTPLVVFDETSFTINQLYATNSSFAGSGAIACGGSIVNQDTFFVWTAACDGEYQFQVNEEPMLYIYEGGRCGAACFQGYVQATNFNLTATGGQPYLVRVNPFWNNNSIFDFSITRVSPECPDLVVETCLPQTPHHEGGAVTMGNSDFEIFQSVERLRVLPQGGPANEFGMLLVSAGAGSAIPLNQGVLCLDGPIGRYDPVNAQHLNNMTINSIGSFDAQTGDFYVSGAAEPGFLVPTFLPNPPGGNIAPGDQWYFQLWYRDETPGGAPSSNMSDVLRVTFS